MPKPSTRSLTPGMLTGLYFLQKYRFFSISHFARIGGFSHKYAAEILGDFERRGYVGYFGNSGIPGLGKTPKVYYIKRKRWEILCTESSEDISPFSEVHKETTWTPQMYHRLKIIDILI